MRKILSLMALVAVASSSATSVVACSNSKSEVKTADTLNGKSFTVKLGSFTSKNGTDYKNASDQWGINSVGALYATLWSINNKAAQGKDPKHPHKDTTYDYVYQNKDVAAYLTKGENFNRSFDNDSGTTVFINPTAKDPQSQFAKHQKDKADWHKDTLKAGDKVEFKTPVLTYKKDKDGKVVVDKTIQEDIFLNIVK